MFNLEIWALAEGQLWNIAKRAQQFDLLSEKIWVEDKMEKEKRENKRRERREKIKGGGGMGD